MNHIEIVIETTDQDIQELLVAQLSLIDYESFEQTETILKAFIQEELFVQNEIEKILQQHSLTYSKSVIQEQNWNALWESNFEPVTVDDFAGIRAHFHQPMTNVQHEIVITPKMSFGTGHHATTFMVMQLMKDVDFTNKTVFDFGSGTGILAILAEKLGAVNIIAADNDDWCIENSLENIQQNNCQQIVIQKVENAQLNKKFNVIIANINKNIILDNIDAIFDNVTKSGVILLSGLLAEDEADILKAVENKTAKHIKTIQKGIWIAMRFDL